MITVVRRPAMLLALALATTACSLTNTADPNTAAIIGDERIRVATIESNFASIERSDAFQQQAQQDPTGELESRIQSQLLTSSVRSSLLEAIARRNEVAVTDEDVQTALDEILEQVGGPDQLEERLAQQGVPEALFLEQVRAQELQAALQEELGAQEDFVAFVTEETADLDIRINPRYGEWNPDTLEVELVDPLAPTGAQAAAQEQPTGR